MIKKTFLFLIFIFLSFSVFSQSSSNAGDNSDNEIPQSLQDIRRFEIITLGAMPFVMMDTTLVYSSARYIKNNFNSSMTPTPFATGTSFSSDEQMKLVFTSLGISAAVGLTDFIVRLIKRTSNQKQQELKNRADRAEIEIIKLDSDFLDNDFIENSDTDLTEGAVRIKPLQDK